MKTLFLLCKNIRTREFEERDIRTLIATNYNTDIFWKKRKNSSYLILLSFFREIIIVSIKGTTAISRVNVKNT